jgi:hypothetical protein
MPLSLPRYQATALRTIRGPAQTYTELRWDKPTRSGRILSANSAYVTREPRQPGKINLS